MSTGGPLTKPSPIGVAHSKREITIFAGMSLTKEFTKEILRVALKLIGLIPLLNYTVIQQRVSMGGHPLTKQRPIGVAHSKREISNYAGMSFAKDLIDRILRDPLKVLGLIPFLNYTVI